MNTVLERGITLEAAKTEEWFGDSKVINKVDLEFRGYPILLISKKNSFT